MTASNLGHSRDDELVTVRMDVPLPGTPPSSGSARAAANATSTLLENVSNEDFLKLVQHFLASADQVQNQMGKIGVLVSKTDQLVFNQTSTSAQVVGMKGSLDSFHSRLIELEEGPKDRPPNQASSSTSVRGDMSCATAASPATIPTQPSSSPEAYTHWDRPMDSTDLRAGTNQNKVALGAVGDAFADFFQIINLPSDRYFV